jgi:hypothetical protein
MKREYRKPTIHVEVMSLDMPIAAACQSYDEFPELRAQGWFIGGANSTCTFKFDNDKGDMGYINGVGDTLCYHSHARTTLTS